jgi:hypothetical protein
MNFNSSIGGGGLGVMGGGFGMLWFLFGSGVCMCICLCVCVQARVLRSVGVRVVLPRWVLWHTRRHIRLQIEAC